MVPRDSVNDLTTHEIAELLSYEGVAWYTLPEVLREDVKWIDYQDAVEAIFSLTEEISECYGESSDCDEGVREMLIRDLVKVSKLAKLLSETRAVFIPDENTELLCRAYRDGYIPIVSLLKTEGARETEEWFEKECGGGE